jgi:uncharacterized protein
MISLLSTGAADVRRIRTSGQVTDLYLLALAGYLLALAGAHGGRLATFDRRISPGAVEGGRTALHLIPG